MHPEWPNKNQFKGHFDPNFPHNLDWGTKITLNFFFNLVLAQKYKIGDAHYNSAPCDLNLYSWRYFAHIAPYLGCPGPFFVVPMIKTTLKMCQKSLVIIGNN